jgi:probable addiction module antidote protein
MIKTKPWDPAERLKTPEAELAYLEAAFEDGDPAVIAAAFGDIARARGMTKVAKAAGLSRETMYKALSADGNPTIATISKIAKELGYRLKIERAA